MPHSSVTTQQKWQHELGHDLSRRRLLLRQFDQYIDDAAGNDRLEAFWKQQQAREQRVIHELKQLIEEIAGPPRT